ncbi:MAG: hypothetical protein HF981_06490 [Desulfobacteraceae bacterium]|nr:hypothetical protein [Desulfobacteraceae bacterium]MBC2750017.1 rubredoxin [Desulfobacteraceae bacterium]
MKGKRWVWLIGLVVAISLAAPQVYAAWEDITPDVGITAAAPVTNTDGSGELVTTVQVTVKNLRDDYIEGAFRLMVLPADGMGALCYYDGIKGEIGQEPTPYFDLVTGDEGLWDQEEEVVVTVAFYGSDPEYDLTVEGNDASVTQTIFRKKISKTPEFYSGEAKMSVVPIYAPMKSSKGYYYTINDLGEAELTDSLEPLADAPEVKPIVVTYLQEEERAPFNSVPDYDPNEDGIAEEGDRYAREVYAAVSFDDGATWKRRNVSRSARKSSYILPNGVDYPGDSESQDLKVVGPYMLVTWMDTLCRSGNPWDIAKEDDHYQVTGSQAHVDYNDAHGDNEPRPDLGIRPFHCLWSARGYLDPESNEVVWMKAEQLSVGRRDAYQNFTAGIEPVFAQPPRGRNNNGVHEPLPGTGGFGLSWQEDPKGLKAGNSRGPGSGLSGACVNHKTDIWYSAINWADFKIIDEDFEPQAGTGDAEPIGDDGGYTEFDCGTCAYVYDPIVGDPDAGIPAETKFIDLPDDWTCPRCGGAKADFEKDSMPHALVAFAPPVRITDNAVCQDRIPEDVWGHLHLMDATEEPVASCDYTYDGGTPQQPLLWEELPDDWTCPKCGSGKETFEYTVIKIKHMGPAYCSWFKDNPRVDRDDEYVHPTDPAYLDARYCLDGEWLAADDPDEVLGDKDTDFDIAYDEDGKYLGAEINGRLAVWTGQPLDGNTGASRANLELVNWDGKTSAVMAYEETKGGEGSDKEAMAPEQKAGIPVMVTSGGEVIPSMDAYRALDSSAISVVQGPYTNSMCISCHYEHTVPVDRVIPAPNEGACLANKAKWKPQEVSAIWQYANYPLAEDEVPAPGDSSFITSCVKFEEGMKICTKDSTDTDCAYKALPDKLPGWHGPTQDCAGCHLPFATKDLDDDLVADRFDKCLDTPADEDVDFVSDSETYGCSANQTPGETVAEEKERHGKSVYYHHFPFDFGGLSAETLKAETVRTGHRVNQMGWDYDKGEPSDDNARRVRVVVNSSPIPASEGGKDLKLGLLYKQGIGGQGAPADAMVQLFSGGFDPDHILKKEDGSPQVWNVSASTVLALGEPNATDPDGENGGSTPKVVGYGWGNHNLDDYADWNPFENVFSTRLALKGDNVVTGYAYSANWAAARNAKDVYDFYVRYSPDGGDNWSRPVNVTNLKNNEETVSDCRVMLTPPTQLPWQYNQGEDSWYLYDPLAKDLVASDVSVDDFMFFGIGTKVNTPQPRGNTIEFEESEIFLDLSWARGAMPLAAQQRTGLTQLDRDPQRLNIHMEYDPERLNQNYDPDAGAYLNPLYLNLPKDVLDVQRTVTNDITYGDELGFLPNRPNLNYNEADLDSLPYFAEDGTPIMAETYPLDGGAFIYNPVNVNALEYSTHRWVAKGDANQGDIQVTSNPDGTKFFAIWEQELPILEDGSQDHFEGADVWFRKELGDEVLSATTVRDVALDGDINQDGTLNWSDGRLILRNIGKTAYDADFLWRGDYDSDLRIKGRDFSEWKRIYIKDRLSKLRSKWKSR